MFRGGRWGGYVQRRWRSWVSARALSHGAGRLGRDLRETDGHGAQWTFFLWRVAYGLHHLG